MEIVIRMCLSFFYVLSVMQESKLIMFVQDGSGSSILWTCSKLLKLSGLYWFKNQIEGLKVLTSKTKKYVKKIVEDLFVFT